MLKLRLVFPGVADVEAWASFAILEADDRYRYEAERDLRPLVAIDVIGADSAVKAVRGAILMNTAVRIEDEDGKHYAVQLGSAERATSRVARVGNLVHCLVALGELGRYFPFLDGQSPEEAYAARLNETAGIPILPEWGYYLWNVRPQYRPTKLLTLGVLPSGITAFYKCPWNAGASAENDVSDGIKSGKIRLPVPIGASSVSWDGIATLDDYLKTFAPAVASKVARAHPPLHTPGLPGNPRIRDLLREPFEAQAGVIQGTCDELRLKRNAFIVGEMGCGKTQIGAAIPYVMCEDNYRVLVMCPGHLVMKWAREIISTVPDAETAVITSWQDMMKLTKHPEMKPLGRQYFILSKETMKLGAHKRPAAIWRPAVFAKKGKREGQVVRGGYWVCPDCGAPVRDPYGIPLDESGFGRPTVSNSKCTHEIVTEGKTRACGASLWTADNTKVHKVAVVDLVKRLPNGYFDFFVADECHELKGESAQGIAFGAAAQKAKKTLALTGMLLGGYASDVFYLLWRMDAPMMRSDGMEFSKRHQFVSEYGVIERITTERDGEANLSSRGRKTTRDVEQPGVSPRPFSNHILQSTAFLELSNLRKSETKSRSITLPLRFSP